jgi:hypothetical protein
MNSSTISALDSAQSSVPTLLVKQSIDNFFSIYSELFAPIYISKIKENLSLS